MGDGRERHEGARKDLGFEHLRFQRGREHLVWLGQMRVRLGCQLNV